MYDFRIADVALRSEMALPSYAAFAAETSEPDVTLLMTDEKAPSGQEIVSGDIVHRKLPDGWFCHGLRGDDEGMFISGDYSLLRYKGKNSPSGARAAERYMRLALECLLIRRGFVSMHAAAVELDGEAYAFTGPSGVGKSTRAKAWTDALGARLISGDRPLIRVETTELFGVPWDGKEQCFRSVRFPLKAVCEVYRGEQLQAKKMSVSQCRRLLVKQCFLPMWDTETAMLQMENIFRLAGSGLMLRTFGGRSPEDAERLHGMIVGNSYLKEEPDVKAKPGFVLRKVAGEYMLMPTDRNIGVYKGAVLFNGVSAFIWEKMQKDVSRDELLSAVLNEFDTDGDTAAKDLDALLEKLDKMELIERG